MSLRVLGYRAYRLRRLILLAIVPPALVVLALAAMKGPGAFVFLVLAVGLPLLHALRYPTAWTETLVVSGVLAVLLALAGTIGPDVGLPGLALRLVGLGLLGFALFLAGTVIAAGLLERGTPRAVLTKASRRSRLPLEEIKPRITLWPGRKDARTTCGAADAEGAFLVTLHHKMSDLSEQGYQDFDIELYAQILEDTETAHEVMSVAVRAPDLLETEEDEAAPAEKPAPLIAVTRYEFRPLARGTRVTLAERGVDMTPLMALGYWLQDYHADYLTDEIDRAEGRRPRANRSTAQEQMVVDIGRWFAGLSPQHPAE